MLHSWLKMNDWSLTTICIIMVLLHILCIMDYASHVIWRRYDKCTIIFEKVIPETNVNKPVYMTEIQVWLIKYYFGNNYDLTSNGQCDLSIAQAQQSWKRGAQLRWPRGYGVVMPGLFGFCGYGFDSQFGQGDYNRCPL